MVDSSEQIRIGVIGAGTISQSVHLTSLRRAGFEIGMVCDLSPSRAREVAHSVGAVHTTRPERMLASSDIDAVLIATPGTHAQLSLEALRAGKHVLAEKPLAYTVREVDEIAEAASRAGRIAQVGYMKAHDPLIPVAQRELDAAQQIRLVRITVLHPADAPQVAHLRLEQAPRDADPAAITESLRYDEERLADALPVASQALRDYYANVLNGSVVHELSLLRALNIPVPDAWHANVVTPLDGPEPASLLATATLDSTAYVLSWNWVPEYPEYHEEVAVYASNARLELRMAKPYLLEERSRLVSRTNDGELRKDTEYFSGHETGFLRQLDAFRHAIHSGVMEDPNLAGVRTDVGRLQRLARAIGVASGEEDAQIEVDQAHDGLGTNHSVGASA